MSPSLQTSCMWDCLVTIKTIISFLQKSCNEQNLCNQFNQLTLSSNQSQNITAHTAVKPLKNVMMELLLDLCAVMFDGMYLTLKLNVTSVLSFESEIIVDCLVMLYVLLFPQYISVHKVTREGFNNFFNMRQVCFPKINN